MEVKRCIFMNVILNLKEYSMNVPKFLLADNSQVDDAFVLHTQYPRFLLNVNTDEVEWYDALDDDPDVNNQVKILFEEAYNFFDDEIENYEEVDEEEYGV